MRVITLIIALTIGNFLYQFGYNIITGYPAYYGIAAERSFFMACGILIYVLSNQFD